MPPCTAKNTFTNKQNTFAPRKIWVSNTEQIQHCHRHHSNRLNFLFHLLYTSLSDHFSGPHKKLSTSVPHIKFCLVCLVYGTLYLTVRAFLLFKNRYDRNYLILRAAYQTIQNLNKDFEHTGAPPPPNKK